LIQLPGTAVRIEVNAFARHLGSRPLLRNLIDRHMYALTRQILHGAACNHLHNTEQRCARWLLMTHDRAGAETFPLTQEFLANMLAVRRATVNEATGKLKRAGFIQYVRGRLTIIDLKIATFNINNINKRLHNLMAWLAKGAARRRLPPGAQGRAAQHFRRVPFVTSAIAESG
jgi:hypothetical protein